MEIPPSQSLATPLRRTKSIATMSTSEIPFDIASTPPSSFDYDLISVKPSSFVAYTSLRDIISSSPSNSSLALPTINGSCSPVISTAGDISIRNRLVKQAALSYLQPTALTSSDDSPGSQFFRRVWLHISAGIQFLRRVFDWLFQSIRVPLIVK
ncbi:hypothetical protein CARUB_v10002184mg [Capsella rubella]|uniref:Uncharacterized protein n=1 Tax=Capsella rubella TaxID=81985 RepID=R0HDA3_9BRAS|nr:uncharacterized protein LOC17883199 [Capsella rubella]EOA21738.1 hypothetical protein CARUB_v10002184mg [Capsella rubella]